ncbi:hypothetical protein [Agromyces indicus]|uniref:SseB protein N-terminal domain-containing protein n=1 Tax=Agromyces indicus TaxID=758919 RepID=A0ABU1FJK6_9MICO|nr:hypothetical protein [Agromyces indicus]MDR5691943.1 hypothetical protein [Agromyces indicus]
MFRRWRRARLAAQAAAHTAPAAPSPAATAADLRGEHIFELVNARLSRFIGPEGDWSLVRRGDDDTDRIFQSMLTHQIAAEVTRAILEEREQVAVVVPADEASLALSWSPAPLVMWADPIDTGADTLDDELPSTDAAGDDALLAASVPAPVAATDPAKAA